MVEEGHFALGDPIDRWAPEFARMRVLRSPDGPLDQTEPAGRPITFEDLLTHRAGLTYADFRRGPVGAAYARALGPNIDNPLEPEAWIAALAALPLIDQPGAAFHYSHATDLLGFILARIDGATLGEVLQRRVFGPLGMTNTGFQVPQEQRARRAAAHGFDHADRLVRLDAVPGGHALPERPDGMSFQSGGQGLWSTLDDYLAFARLFVEGGAVDGVRVLQPETVALLASNHLTDDQRARSGILGMPVFAAGHGFGLGVAVVTEPERADPSLCGGGLGAVGWPGAYGGWWRADPSGGSVLIFLTHNMVGLEQMTRGVGMGVYGARAAFQRLASGTYQSSPASISA